MKSCIIIGNPNDQQDESLRYNNLFPSILHLMDSTGFKKIYLTLDNAFERIAALEYALHTHLVPCIKLCLYHVTLSSHYLYRQVFRVAECIDSTIGQADILQQASHVLTIDSGIPAGITPEHAYLRLSQEELCASSDASFQRMTEWLQKRPPV